MRKFVFVFTLALASAINAAAQTRPTPAPTPARTNTPARPAATPAPRPAASPTQGATTTPRPAPTQPQAAAPRPAPSPAPVPCGCELTLPEVLATVNGVRVTKNDLSPRVQQRLQQIYNEVGEVRRNEVRMLVNTKLLEAEAKKRNTTTDKLYEQEVVAKVAKPTEAEALAFYNENKARIQQSAGRNVEFNDIKTNIIEHLNDERMRAATQQFAERLRAASQVQIMTEVATPPATPADRARVLAVVNGEKLTSGDVEDDLRPLIFSAQEQAYTLVRNDVETKINDILLEQEAQKRKVTTTSLMQTEVRAKVPAVTDAQAQTFFNENKARINGTFEQIKPQIIQYLTEQEGRKAEAAFAEQLRRASAVETFVKAPEQPVFQIATDDQPTKGNPAATVTLVEFTDFQCPACAQTHPVIERLATEYADRVKFVLRDFPLTQHAEAFKAAEAAEAAREQGKYWEYVNVLFRNQSALQVPKLKEYAAQVGLDLVKFSSALDSGRFADKVRRDLQDGSRVGVNGTPTIYVNGRRVNDRSYEGLKATLDAALRGGTAARK